MPQNLAIEQLLPELFGGLPERSRDVIISRFGIGRKHSETLESIGKRYSITRERVRQIEADALKTIRARASVLRPAFEALGSYIKARGGVVEERYLKKGFAEEMFIAEDASHYEGATGLFLSLGAQFKKAAPPASFATRWYLSERDLRLQETIAKELGAHLKKIDSVMAEDEVISY